MTPERVPCDVGSGPVEFLLATIDAIRHLIAKEDADGR